MTYICINGQFLFALDMNHPFFDYHNLQMSSILCYFVCIYDILTILF